MRVKAQEDATNDSHKLRTGEDGRGDDLSENEDHGDRQRHGHIARHKLGEEDGQGLIGKTVEEEKGHLQMESTVLVCIHGSHAT